MGSQLAEPGREPLLGLLGLRVRAARARRGMTRRTLAKDADVSERYLAQLESGGANPSVAVLRRIADAMALPLVDLVAEEGEDRVELGLAVAALRRLPPERLGEARRYLEAVLHPERGDLRERRISLVGLRGAGKSTLGTAVARRLGVPFIELDRLLELERGAAVGEILALYGQPALRRYERACLERVIAETPAAVIATGGGIVGSTASLALLLGRTHCVWVRATPEEHMARVVAQGDFRPMAQNAGAMADLRAILQARQGFYGQAHAVVDTDGCSPDQSAEDLYRVALGLFAGSGARIGSTSS
jgi:XRE family aerobic/anaerobic benzoate catabolism transcriptional regulator